MNFMFIKKKNLKYKYYLYLKKKNLIKMNIYFFGKRYLTGLTLIIFLNNVVFGIGLKRFINYFIFKYGFSKTLKVYLIPLKILIVYQSIFFNSLLNYKLFKVINFFILKKKKLKLYQSLRKSLYLPSRGQNSRTNARTVKRLKRKHYRRI